MARCHLQVFSVFMVLLKAATLSQGCPAACTCDGNKVNCYGRELTEIPQDIPSNVVYLDLQHNHIESLDASRFQNLSNLQEIILRYNRLTALPDHAFSNLPSLKHLQLGSNLLTSLKKDAFVNLPNLNILDVTENQLISIDGAFDNIPSLTRLVLSKNALTNLTDSAFAPLSKLIYLMLSENKISYISPTAFDGLKELSYLTLRDNPLRNIDNILKQNVHLSYLDLTNCSLQAVPDGLPWATRYLQLGQNNITRIAKNSFQKTRYLGIIILDENYISDIEPGSLLPIAHLQQLWLNGNNLTIFPSPLPPSVQIVCIDKNAITTISNHDFASLSKLQLLSLKGNKISSLSPYTFSSLGSLQKLYLSSNLLAELKDGTFSGLRNLTILDVGRNPIMHIATRFAAGLQSLEELDLSFVEDTEPILQGNFFRDIPFMKKLDLRFSPSLAKNIMGSKETVQSLYNLQTLNLMDNQLETLELDLPRYFPHLQVIQLSQNPWRCDLKLKWLQDWIQRQRSLFADAENIVCFSPEHLQGLAIADLPAAAFDYTTTTPMVTSMKITEYLGSGDSETDSSGDVHGKSYSLHQSTTPQMKPSQMDFTETEPIITWMSSTQTPDTQVTEHFSATQKSSTTATTEISLPANETLTTKGLPSSSRTSDKVSTIVSTAIRDQNATVTMFKVTSVETPSKKSSTFSATFSKSQSIPVLTTAEQSKLSVKPVTGAETTINNPLTSPTSVVMTFLHSKVTTTPASRELPWISSQNPHTNFTNESNTAGMSSTETSPHTVGASSTRKNTLASTIRTTTKVSAKATTSTTFSDRTDQDAATGESSHQKSTIQPEALPSTVQSSSTASSAAHFNQTSSNMSQTSQRQSQRSEGLATISLPASGVPEVITESSSTSTATMSNIIPSLTSTIQMDTNSPLSNIPSIRPNNNRMPSLSEASSNTRMIITATSITILCLIITLLLAAFLRRHRGKIKRLYHHAMSYTIETSDTAFVLSDQDEPDMLSERSFTGQRSQSDVGSTGSRPSVDTIQESDTAINGFGWSKLE